MSLDGRYILMYVNNTYSFPTPMELDKKIIEQEIGKVDFTELDSGFTIHFAMNKYRLDPDLLDKLHADKIMEALDGDIYNEIRH